MASAGEQGSKGRVGKKRGSPLSPKNLWRVGSWKKDANAEGGNNGRKKKEFKRDDDELSAVGKRGIDEGKDCGTRGSWEGGFSKREKDRRGGSRTANFCERGRTHIARNGSKGKRNFSLKKGSGGGNKMKGSAGSCPRKGKASREKISQKGGKKL